MLRLGLNQTRLAATRDRDMNYSDKQNTESQRDKALRRRLLKASAVAPVVATLTPNSAFALSSAANCAGGDFSNKKFAKNGNSLNGDTAVRQAVDYWQKSGPNVPGLPNKVYLIDGMFYSQNGTSYVDTPQVRQKLRDHYDHDTAHVLALFDVSQGDAQLKGLWPKYQIDDMHATPLTGSCWTSLTAGSSSNYGL